MFPQIPTVSPEAVGMNSKYLNRADSVLLKAVENKEIPGAVLGVVKNGKIIHLKAFGYKEIYPNQIEMDTNAIFDLASLTKPIVTATSTLILIEQGKLRLNDKVNFFLPNFEGFKNKEGKTVDIKIVDLLTHTSGLPPYVSPATIKKQFGEQNPDVLINYISKCNRDFEPQTSMQYSCLNYIVLQRIIEKISNESLQNFAQKNIFSPLGMNNTDFNPSKDKLEKIVPTEKQKDGTVLRGVVHDPIARELNKGISGNAGLFSDVMDLAKFIEALLNGGEWNGKRILSPLGIQKMISIPQHVSQFGRTLGWDIFSPYASNNGDLLSSSTFGHTGYTGTSITIDPENKIGIILLTNRVHPEDKGSVNRLRGLIANCIAASVFDENKSNTASQPAWSYESHYKKRLEQFNSETPISSDDIVMLGNSLTEGGGDWSKITGVKNIRNRGIVGDNTIGILKRLGEITKGKPKKLFLLIGINDIANGSSTDDILSNIQLIIQKTKIDSSTTRIYIQSLLPVNQSFQRYKNLNNKENTIIELNQKLFQLTKKHKIIFIDTYPYFQEEKNDVLRKDFTTDGLHLNQKGYENWSKILIPYLK